MVSNAIKREVKCSPANHSSILQIVTRYCTTLLNIAKMSRFAAAFVLCLCLVGVSVSQEMDIQDWLDDASWRESEDPSDGEPDGFSKLPGPKANGAGGRRPATPRYVLAQKCIGILGSFPVSDPGANRANRESRP